jgi:predicted ArsR family transcriptional regulator
VKPRLANTRDVIVFALKLASKPLSVVDFAVITGQDTSDVRKHLGRLEREGVVRELLLPPPPHLRDLSAPRVRYELAGRAA